MLRALWHDDLGFILSAELVLILTLGVLAMVVGIHAIAKSLNQELIDIADSFGTFNQSFSVQGFLYCIVDCEPNAFVPGFGFSDGSDFCDCAVITFTPPVVKTQPNNGTTPGN
jgi:hypothetical protein